MGGTVLCALVSIIFITFGSWAIGIPTSITELIAGEITGASVLAVIFFGGEVCRASIPHRVQWGVLGAINAIFLFFTPPAPWMWKAGVLAGSVLGLYLSRWIVKALQEMK